MSPKEWKTMEDELLRLKPAPLPDEFQQRLRAAFTASVQNLPPTPRVSLRSIHWFWRLKWVAPAAAAVALAWIWLPRSGMTDKPVLASVAAMPGLTVDRIEIDRQLVDAFEGLAQLPDGKPLRFRCYNWVDHIRMRDSAQGVEIERNEPFREIVPVRYDHD
jgi:hypothetical protein